ncbi:Taxane 13-alpha-hydroxylase [Glycine soja]|uniref:Taxane 13-alpha-hydroxylase n=1 Tax=Glycine soja TaxID=3848 RepID=A0A445H0L5_GLYSO|nr:Taxane 13-alpha-hydroxylase [Glycine soja]
MGFPLKGETMEFFNAQRRNQLFEEFVHPRILKHGKIFRTRIMGSPTVVVNGAEANKFLLSNEFKLVKSSWPSSSVELMGRDSIMEKDGERHRFLRGVIGTSLGYAGLELLVLKLCISVQFHLTTNWKGQQKISLYRSTKVLSFSVVFECLLGIKVEPEGQGGDRKDVGQSGEREEKGNGRKHGKRTRWNAAVQIGIRDDPRGEKEVIDNVVLLVFAAHDTTFAVAMTFKMLAKHPD